MSRKVHSTRSRQRHLRAVERGEDVSFDARELSRFLADAFTVAIRPASGRLSDSSLARCRKYAAAVAKALLNDVHKGYMGLDELTAVLTGAALFVAQCQIEDDDDGHSN